MSTTEPEKPADLLPAILLTFVVLFVAYSAYALSQNWGHVGERKNELAADIFQCVGILISFCSSIFYFPYLCWVTARRKTYIQTLGAMRLYLLVGCAFTFAGSIMAFIVLLEPIYKKLFA